MFSFSSTLKGSVILASAMALCGTAAAQAASSCSATDTWSFAIDRYSPGSDLLVQDTGETTYHTNQTGSYQGGSPIIYESDGGTASAPQPSASFSASTSSGYNNVTAWANSGLSGSAFASVGSYDILHLTDADSVPVKIDVTSTVAIQSNVSAVTGNAEGQAIVLLEAYLLTSGGTTQWFDVTDDIEISNDTSPSVQSFVNGYTVDSSSADGFTASAEFSITLRPGDVISLGNYAETENGASITGVVPTPSSGATLAMGLGGLALIRRRRKLRG